MTCLWVDVQVTYWSYICKLFIKSQLLKSSTVTVGAPACHISHFPPGNCNIRSRKRFIERAQLLLSTLQPSQDIHSPIMCQPTWHARLLGVCVKMFVVKTRTQPNVHLETHNNKSGWNAPGRTAENIKLYKSAVCQLTCTPVFPNQNPRNRSTPGGGRVRADGPDNTSCSYRMKPDLANTQPQPGGQKNKYSNAKYTSK